MSQAWAGCGFFLFYDLMELLYACSEVSKISLWAITPV